MAYVPIRDYAVIGNLRSAILVSKDGSIDWAPAPFIDSPTVFASILDDQRGGFWSIQPRESYTSTQYYLNKTNILVTKFHIGESAEMTITDFIPIEEEQKYLPAEEDTTFKIKRKVTCTKGTCSYKAHFNPQFNYARGKTHLRAIDKAIYAENESRKGVLVSHHMFTIDERGARAECVLHEGESEFFVFRHNIGEVQPEKDDPAHHAAELEENALFWREWADRCDLQRCAPISGEFDDLIVRSALVLKILFFEPVGTVAAAPTTSLPEHVGGVRNWDYRFTWLRDSAFIFQAFYRLGHILEAEEYIHWLINQCKLAIDPSNITILCGLRPESVLDEEPLPHLEGYRSSKPVRIGNNAYEQEQWDIYGSILNTVWGLHKFKGGGVVDKEIWKQLCRIADYVCDIWREPDEGLWEIRGGKNHFVYSKVMCWVALARACQLKQEYDFEEGDIPRWQKERDAIRKEVMEQGWSEEQQSFVQSFGSASLDAALLLLPCLGFIEGDDPKMLSTIDAIRNSLCYDGTFVYRYTSDDGLPGEEGAFLLASFWLVDALIRARRVEEAKELFNRLKESANHVGLYSEEIDPRTGDFLGNFPQAYTHVGLINSAITLSRIEQEEK